MKNTYWNGEGKLQKYADKLHKLIPREGEVEDVANNPKLEKYRKASNCYYDLYNNGLGNKAKEFRQVFGMPGTHILKFGNPHSPDLEHKMTMIIIDACLEQGLI